MFRKKVISTLALRLALLLASVSLLSACINTAKHPQTSWHDSLPPKQYFINKYKALPGEHNSTEIDNHLVWIKRFYLGSRLYSKGWLDVSQLVSNSLSNPNEINDIEGRMHQLGKTIVVEWAQDNSIRKINTQNLIIWGNALLKSIEFGDQINLIGFIEQDVDLLINNRLESKQITSERYYATEDYDNF